MKGITELSYLLPDLFTARNVAEDKFRLCDGHAALGVTCRLGHMSLSRQCQPFLSPPFSFHVSVRACLLRDIATTCRVRYVEGSVNAAQVLRVGRIGDMSPRRHFEL